MFSALSSLMDPAASGSGSANPAQPPLPAHIQAYGDEIRAMKASLKASGATNKQLKTHPQVASMVARLDQMKSQAGIDPKTNLPFNAPKPVAAAPKAPAPPSKPLPPELQGAGAQLRDLKSQLKARGMTGDQIKQNPQVKAMTNQLNTAMQARVPAKPRPQQAQPQTSAWNLWGSTATAKSSPPLPPQLQAQKSQLQAVKNNLRSQGIKGEQLVQHQQVKAMQTQLDQAVRQWNGQPLKAQQNRSSPAPVVAQAPNPSQLSFAGATGRQQAMAMAARPAPSQLSFVGTAGRQQAMAAAVTGPVPSTNSFAAPAGSVMPRQTSFATPYGSVMPPSASFAASHVMPRQPQGSTYSAQAPALPYSMSFQR